MKFYLTHWSKPNQSNKDITIIKKFMEMSVFELKKKYKDINLITDDIGQKELKYIGWTSISNILDDIDEKYKDIWSLGKIKAYIELAKRGDHFIHIDYDFFITKYLKEDVLQADLVVEGEEDLNKYHYNINYFNSLCKNKYLAESSNINKAYTCGIFGGKDLLFIYDYASSAYKMATDPLNEDFFLTPNDIHQKKYTNYKSFNKATIPEQYYLSACMHKWNKKPFLFWRSACEDIMINQVKDHWRDPSYDPNYFDFFRRTGCIHFFGIHKGLLQRFIKALGHIDNLNYKKL